MNFRESLLLVVLVGCLGCSRSHDIGLQIEHRRISIDDFLGSLSRQDLLLFSPYQLDSLWDELTTDQLMLYDAYRQRYNHKDTVITALNAYRYNYLIEYYLKTRIVDSLVTEKDLIKRYRSYSPEYRSYHPYQKVRADLYKDELTRRRRSIENAIDGFYQNLKSAAMLRLLHPSFDNFLKKYNDCYRQSAVNSSPDPIEILVRTTHDSALAQIKNQTFNRQWLIEVLKLRQIAIPTGVLSPTTFSNILETLIVEDLIYTQAKAAKLEREQAYRQAVKRYSDDFILHLYQIENISRRINYAEDSVRAFYEKQKSSRYLQPAAMEVAVIFLSDSLKARAVLERALKGENFNTLYRKYNARPMPRNGYLGLITAEDYGAIGRAALQAKPHQVLPFLVPSGKYFTIVKTLDYRSAIPADYESLKTQVASHYSDECYKTIRQKLATELRSKYKTILFNANLSRYIASLGEQN